MKSLVFVMMASLVSPLALQNAQAAEWEDNCVPAGMVYPDDKEAEVGIAIAAPGAFVAANTFGRNKLKPKKIRKRLGKLLPYYRPIPLKQALRLRSERNIKILRTTRGIASAIMVAGGLLIADSQTSELLTCPVFGAPMSDRETKDSSGVPSGDGGMGLESAASSQPLN